MGDLHHAAIVDGAGQRDQHAAGSGRVAHRSEPPRPVPGDQPDVGQGLDVVDQCRPPPDPGYRGEHRPVAGQRGTALDPAYERGFLARDEGVGSLDEADRVAIDARGPTLLDRIRHRGHQLRRQIRIDRVGADGGSGGGQAVEHQMRGVGEQPGVLTAQRLALGAVGDDDRPAAGDRGHLRAGGEPAAAASAQPGLIERGDQLGSQSSGQRPEALVVCGQRGPVRGEQARDGRCGVRVGGHRVVAGVRVRAYSTKSARSRNITEIATSRAQLAANNWNHRCPVSVPLPSPCASATGHSR